MPSGCRTSCKRKRQAVLSAHCLPQIIKRTIKQLYLASRDKLNDLRPISQYLRMPDRNTTTLLSVVAKMAIDALLCTTIIEKHILATLFNVQKVTGCDTSPVAIILSRDMTASTILNGKNTELVTDKTHKEPEDDT